MERYHLHRNHNKIVEGEGICLGIQAFSIKSSEIQNDTGDVVVHVEILCLVWSSFKDELLKGKIIRCDEQGIVCKIFDFLIKIKKRVSTTLKYLFHKFYSRMTQHLIQRIICGDGITMVINCIIIQEALLCLKLHN